MDPSIMYKVHGPKLQINFAVDDAYLGGPVSTLDYPESAQIGMHEFPKMEVPLTYPVSMDDYPNTTGALRRTYGKLELVDVQFPQLRAVEFYHEEASSKTVQLINAGDFVMEFKCNYTQPRQQFFHYKHTQIDQTVAEGTMRVAESGTPSPVDIENITYGVNEIPGSGKLVFGDPQDSGVTLQELAYTSATPLADPDSYRFTQITGTIPLIPVGTMVRVIDLATDDTKEGPASEISEEISIMPGEMLKLNVPQGAGYFRTNLYRSANNSTSGFRLLSEIEDAAVFYDDMHLPLMDDLPAEGSYPHATRALARDNAIRHPAGFWVLKHEDHLRPTDYYRGYAADDEFAVPFGSVVLAQVLINGSILVWTEDGKVFRVVGQSPGMLSHYEVSTTVPLLNKLGIAKINNMVVYPSTDGLIAIGEGEPINLTAGHYTREEWAKHYPAFMQAHVADNSIFYLYHGDTTAEPMRFDLDEKLKAITTFTDFNNVPLEWQSRVHTFPKRITPNCLRVDADGYPVTISILADDRERCNVQVYDDQPMRLPAQMRNVKTMALAFNVKSRHTVHEVAIGTNMGELGRR
ncbi:hypothetical protein BVY04_03760 [bacterium M21]|nr:hypothetical protein BVY04_03760 [bacterium M21]